MKLTTVLSIVLLGPPAAAQEPTPKELTPVQRVLLLFDGADANDDRRIVPEEALDAGIRGGDFAAHDHDGDRAWAPDEFLVYYHQLLGRAGHTVDPELDQAVQRVLETRRKAAERARLARAEAARAAREAAEQGSDPAAAPAEGTPAAEAPSEAAPAPSATGQVASPAGTPEGTPAAPVAEAAPAEGNAPAAEGAGPATLDEKLAQARQDLQQRAANADGATREQFDEAAAQLDERARNAAANPPAASETPAPAAEAPAPGSPAPGSPVAEAANPAGQDPAAGATDPAQPTTLRDKLNQAKQDLAERAANADGATREQYEQAAGQLDERARAAAGVQHQAGDTFEGVPLDEKLAAALRAVDERGRAAGASPEAIAEQKKQLVLRARNAAEDPAVASVDPGPEPVRLGPERRAARKQEGLAPAGGAAPAQRPEAAGPARVRSVLGTLVSRGRLDQAQAESALRVLEPGVEVPEAERAALRQAITQVHARLQAAVQSGDLTGPEAREVHQQLVERAQAVGVVPQAEEPPAGEPAPAGEQGEDARARAAREAREKARQQAEENDRRSRAAGQEPAPERAPERATARPQERPQPAPEAGRPAGGREKPAPEAGRGRGGNDPGAKPAPQGRKGRGGR